MRSFVHIEHVHEAITSTTTSSAIQLGAPGSPDPYAKGGTAFAIQTHNVSGEAGDGSWTITFQTSIYGTHYSTPSGYSDIATGHTRTSGNDSNGIETYSFTMPACLYLKIVATLDSGTPDSGLNIDLVIWQ
jgi:hypothetical protein